jgi:hypothetical protein
MSFESAVAIAQVIGVLGSILWLTMPITAVASILRRRRHRPGSSNWWAYSVLVGWFLTIVGCVVSFVSGTWYGENGPPPQIIVIEATMLVLVLAAIHFALIRTSAMPSADDRDST